MREYEELDKLADRGNVRKFYDKMRRLTEGFKTGAYSCRTPKGDLVTDAQSILKLWREHFSSLLNGSESTTPGEGEPDSPIDDDGADVPLPDHEEVRIAITRLKNNKAAGADGLPAELFKHGGEELIRSMHQLICKIWSDESMPNDWNLSVLGPIHKKGDPIICANYRGISLLNIAYKVLSSVLCERLKPTVNELIEPYQCGFRPGKSTTDQIFTMRQILEKTREGRIDTHHIFVDFKAAFDSTKRSCLYAAMSEFGIPAKLIRLCKLTLSNTKSSVRIGKNLSEPFDTKRGFRQGDSLSCDFFNLLLEKIIRAAELNRAGTIVYSCWGMPMILILSVSTPAPLVLLSPD
ncbi:LINE-1 retrotransposable element ORF2 protein isoform X6 [Bactrocera dorsalis]|uniref:LINE-1 retrotransposable element ORF2 protein isoform X6 n=1 Tax=Bactrocera dorsalis TaxID=27457 RepID=A0ABM3IY55_BACDO|nr:LINE-1 retrotransposable element ORF2 protein isoform X6 [Bactrocera dorsalis]